MYRFLLPFLLIVASCGNEVVTSSENDIAEDTIIDFHTTPSDVIDNLFVAVDHQDWNTVNTYYALNAQVTDLSNQTSNDSPSEYFRKLFAAQNIAHIYLHEQQAFNDGIRVKALARKQGNSVELPYCFVFRIQNNRITEQHAITCAEDK